MTSNKIRHFYTLSPYITQYLKNKSSCDITIIIHSSANRSKNSTELNVSQCSDVNLGRPFIESNIWAVTL